MRYCIYDDHDGYGLAIKRDDVPDGGGEHEFCFFHIDADDDQATELEHLIVDFKAARKQWDKVQDSLGFLNILHHAGKAASR